MCIIFPFGVYPRSRGGTTVHQLQQEICLGLSPLTRGNHPKGKIMMDQFGSIPAHAGEPKALFRFLSAGRVYPRSRGGTCRMVDKVLFAWGLSPLTRGNPVHLPPVQAVAGSIPAHAGEPCICVSYSGALGVYPRSRGGTFFYVGPASDAYGLSPLTRGNRFFASRFVISGGSIPAHAGEPKTPRSCKLPGWVYPRSRGGTPVLAVNSSTDNGLSPLTRGNQ